MRVFLIVSFLFTAVSNGQDFQSDFIQYCQTNDTINQLNVLERWNAVTPKDADLFTSYFNYHVLKSRREILNLSTEEPDGERLVLKDSLNNTAGYLGSTIYYDDEELAKGFAKIDQGIKLYPNRLDMRFGKTYILGQIGDWDNFATEIIRAIDHSAVNNNQWTWTNNVLYEGGMQNFLLDVQSYQLQLYNTGEDNLLLYMRDIANAVLEHYPNHVESLSNLSITYLIDREYDKAIEVLLKAEKLKPTDYIVLSNIAQGYKLKGDIANAVAYYEKTILHGNDDAKEYARQQIAALKK